MNESMSTNNNAGRTRAQGRTHRRLVAAICLTALGVGALVATGPVEAATALPAQVTPAPTSVANSTELRNAITNVGGVINIAPGTYDLTAELEIRRNGTQLRAVDPANTTLRYTGKASTSTSRVLEVWATGVVVDGVKITGGNKPIDDGGGGVEVESGASLTLSRSWVTGNVDDIGAGVYNEGTLTVVDSTISGNTASLKGGGLLNEGTATVTNSTVDGNRAPLGAGITSFSTISVAHTTIVRNVSTSSSVAGLQQYGGTFNVRYSIVGDNLMSNGTAARNCGGTVSVRDINLVSTTTGCTTSGTVLTGGPMVGPLQNNGGPTPTTTPLDGSKAINAVTLSAGKCVSGSTADQRGTARPSGAGCELGSFETAPLGVTATLDVDTANYEAQGLPKGTVEVGATSVPSNLIASELASRATANADGTLNSSALRSIGLRSIGLRSITLEDIGLRSIDPTSTGLRSIELKANGLRSIALRSIGLRSIGLRSIGLRSIGLRSIGLRSIPLSEIPLLEDGGWTALLANSQFADVPLQSITLEDISALDAANNPLVPGVSGLTLENIDLSSTGLRSIALRSILLSGVGLRSIPLPLDPGQTAPGGDYSAAWCQTLFSAEQCADPLFAQDVGDSDLWEMQLAGGNIEQEKVLEVPLSGLTSTALRSIGLRSIGLRSIFLENTALRSIGLRSIALRSIPSRNLDLNSIITCTPNSPATDPCSTATTNTLTLGDVVSGCLPLDVRSATFPDPPNCLLRDNADVGTLLDLLGVDVNVNGVNVNLLKGLTLFDLLFSFVPPEDIPWESVDLESASLQNIANPAQPTFDYVTTVNVVNGPATVDVAVKLPAGFLSTGPANWCTSATSCVPVNAIVAADPTYRVANVPSGTYTLRVPVRAGTTVGDYTTTGTVTVTGPNGAPPAVLTGPVGTNVVQDGAGAPKPNAPILSDGNLQLGYIGGSGELDAYSFTAPAGSTGASARILLSNIPDGVDYDLSVYGPRPTSLRGTPTRELSSLGDIRFGLDPDKDALATDLVNDIAVDINDVAKGITGLEGVSDYALRDISSRRSNNDEEVTLPALVSGKKYVVVVSGYFGDLSPEPYGLRIRLDRRTALPECAAPAIYPGSGAPTAVVPGSLAIENGINTLYVTNGARLDAEAPGRATSASADVITSIARTDGVNGVNAGLLLVDGLGEWSAWNANSCSPDARNAVAKAVGQAIDAANITAGGTITNVVIVGGDGVIPMAAVPDLTKYSNEATFAREVLTPTAAGLRSNAVAGTVGSGYFLSDDPYAATAGISVLGGDHELYVPDRNIGRLVETADEIIGQLDNFKTYDGRLDPKTFEAAVTGYDFLADGAQAITAELGDQFAVSELSDNAWDKTNFYDLFGPDTSGKSKYSVYSPNAHYDYESLLPAAADAADDYTDADLVDTEDFRPGPLGELPAAFAPVAALGFTVGCHAGLSVSDVQLGLPSLDWAQLASSNQSQWVGHTTYGYGDTKIIAFSERLAKLFAGNVADITAGTPGAPATLGAAVRDAKQRYLASTLVLTPYDEKILQSWTYYGLPMYTLGAQAAPGSAPQGIVQPTALAATATSGPATFAGPISGGRVPVSIDLSNGRLARTEVGADGSYYSVDGNTTVAQYRPVQPLVDVAIPGAAAGAFGGFLITGLTSKDLAEPYVPFYSRPLVDNSVDEGRLTADDGAFPATLQRIADLTDGQRLLVAAGQYQGGQRLFEKISGELLPRTNAADTDAPRFLDVTGTNIADVGSGGRGIQFDVRTDGAATRVVILFREEGQANWRTIELSKRTDVSGVATWFGTAPLVSASTTTKAEFFAQNADAAGNVGLTSNKIENFLSVDQGAPPVGGVAPTIVPGATNQVGGRFFTTGATFTITPATATVSVDGLESFPYPATGITLAFAEGAAPSYSNGTLTLDRGSHTILADNAGTQVTRFFIVDPDAPSVSLSHDTAAWTNQPVELLVTANDGSGSGIQSLCVNGDCTATDLLGDGVFQAPPVTISAPDNGFVQQTVTATAKDKLGNQTIKSTTVKVDNAPPVITVTPNDSTQRKGTVTVTVKATDAGSGLATLQINGTAVTIPAGAADFTTTVPASVDDGTTGSFIVNVTATDVAGNETVASPVAVQIDNVLPTITFSRDTDVWTTGSVDVTVTATDVGSGVAELCVDGTCGTSATKIVPVTTPADGIVERPITATAKDAAGNASAPASTTVRIDNAKPVVTITRAPATPWATTAVTVAGTVTDQGSGLESVCVDTGTGCTSLPVDPITGNYSLSITADGSTTVSVTATDDVGLSTTRSTLVQIDTIAPKVTIAPNDGVWRKGPVPVTVTATDGGSKIASVCVANGSGAACDPVTLDANGKYLTTVDVASVGAAPITATAIDVAGNPTTATASLQIDNQAPTFTAITPDTTAWTRNDVTLSISSSDGSGSGVRSITTQNCVGVDCAAEIVTPGATASATVTAPAGQAQISTVKITSTDNVGNSTSETRTVKVDKAKPVVTIAKDPTTSWANGAVKITVTATDEGSGLDTVCLDTGTGCVTVQLDATGTYETTISTDGARLVTVNATDKAGNQAVAQSTTVSIDTVKPVVTIAKDPITTWAKGIVKITVTAVDQGSGLQGVCVQVDTGTCTAVTLVNGKYETTVSTNGTKVFTVNATDNAGNQADPKSTTVNIDTVNPTATLSVTPDANGDGIYNFGESASATFSCADVGSGVATCALFDGAVQVATSSPYTINTSTTGTKTLTVRATDTAGNTITTPAKTLAVGFRTCVLNTSFQSNSLPIYTLRLTLCDAAGTNLSASAITLTALAIDGTRDPIFNFSGLPLNYKFKYVSSGNYYEYTFYVGGLAKGAHTLSFTTQPVPSRSIGTAALHRLATNSAGFTLK